MLEILPVCQAVNGSDYIFHAAALKQVPSCEFFPLEATKTNVLGTYNIIRAANQYNVNKLICLSTDKAAYPINSMGITKALIWKKLQLLSLEIFNSHLHYQIR